jgi:hypothetical protein
MTKRYAALALGLGFLALPRASRGDDLTGQDHILCTAVQATKCTADGDCTSEPPWNLNIPQFLEVNLKDRKVSTTPASGENRATPIKSLERENGLILLQGTEGGRAFSFVIVENTGMASIAVARDALTVSVFGACTPMPASK